MCVAGNCCTSSESPPTTCSNGGQLVAKGCATTAQCTAYTNKPVQCLAGLCCTTSSVSPPSACSNGGQLVATGCTTAAQCTPYTNSPVQCLNGQCCTTPSVTPSQPRCPNGGQPVATGCTTAAQCASYTKDPVQCLSGTKWTIKSEYKRANTTCNWCMTLQSLNHQKCHNKHSDTLASKRMPCEILTDTHARDHDVPLNFRTVTGGDENEGKRGKDENEGGMGMDSGEGWTVARDEEKDREGKRLTGTGSGTEDDLICFVFKFVLIIN
ncbi:hypothetical protein Tcan_13771 [Toxocara canis]|uniref:Uncharacterized protein n=1 Tax=Toxocara canis TaxID=6265 RepID=A0A0B2VYH6_TOXCA|nr:hypothetical protein Tcan_13771 [Toxocara canis]